MFIDKFLHIKYESYSTCFVLHNITLYHDHPTHLFVKAISVLWSRESSCCLSGKTSHITVHHHLRSAAITIIQDGDRWERWLKTIENIRVASSLAWRQHRRSCGVFKSWIYVAHCPFQRKWRVLHIRYISVLEQVGMSFNGIAYEVGEVFPWGGISLIFSVCVSISSVCDPLYEIDLWLDFRHNNKFYGAWISPKLQTMVM